MLAVGKFMIIVSCIILFDTAEKLQRRHAVGLQAYNLNIFFFWEGLFEERFEICWQVWLPHHIREPRCI